MTALYIPGKDSVSQPRGRAEPRERVDDVRGRSTSSRSDEDYEVSVLLEEPHSCYHLRSFFFRKIV